MLNRPLLLKFFIFFLILDPFLRSALISIEKDFSFLVVLQKTFSLSYLDIFNYWILSPLSGLSLLFVNLPALIFYALAQIYSLYFHINYVSYSWPYLSLTPSLTAYVLLAINWSILVYIALPSSLELFSNKALRWWERGSRYSINAPCFILADSLMIDGVLRDISFSGASIILQQELPAGSIVKIDVEILKNSFLLNGELVRLVLIDGSYSYGVKFKFQSYIDLLKLKALMIKINFKGAYPKYR